MASTSWVCGIKGASVTSLAAKALLHDSPGRIATAAAAAGEFIRLFSSRAEPTRSERPAPHLAVGEAASRRRPSATSLLSMRSFGSR